MMKLMTIIFMLSPFLGISQVPAAPNNLQGKFIAANRTILLFWNPSPSKVAGYNLFIKQGNDDSFFLWGKAGLVSDTIYNFQVFSREGASLTFKVCGVQNFPDVLPSDYSNTITVEVPSTFLPMVRLQKPIIKKKTAEVSWEYKKEISDLSGFIIYLDKEQIRVGDMERKYVFNELAPGKHLVYIVAVSSSGLESNPSPKKFIIIK